MMILVELIQGNMKYLRLLTAFFLFTAHISSYAQENEVQKYGNRISTAGLKDYLTILASDALEGRETGKRGQKMAAAFIRAHFEALGLVPPVNGDYFQTFDLYATQPGANYVKVNGVQYNNFGDVTYYGNRDSG